MESEPEIMNSKSKGIGLGIALGAALGALLGIMAGHVAVWLAVGVSIGFAIVGTIRREGIDCPQCAELHREHRPEALRNELRAKSQESRTRKLRS